MSIDHSTRAGKYENQNEGFSAFIPAPLPPNPRIRFTNALQRALSQAEHALDRLNGSIQTVPQPDQFVFMYIRHEAVVSSKIDGVKSSLLDFLASEAQISKNKYSQDILAVSNYITAMKHGLEKVKSVNDFTQIVLELHKALVPNTNDSQLTPGEYRTKQNWIGSAKCSIHDAVFVPPPPNRVVSLMCALDQFIENDAGLPRLVKIGLVHSQFQNIQPFLNDNERISRLIVTLLLQKSNLVEKPVLNLSWFFNRHRQAYYAKLRSVRDAGNWEDWLLFFLRAVKEVGKHSATTIRQILETREANRILINDHLGRASANGHRLLDRLYEFPFVSVNDVKELTGTTFASANALVARMVDVGLLREYTERYRNRRYLLYNYVDLFKEQ